MYDLHDELEIERGIRFLVSSCEKSGNNPKPVILHSIRVGLHLYRLGYGRKIVLAGILHDIIEDTRISEERLQSEFGMDVARIVKANTFDKDINDKKKQYVEAFERCLKAGREALVIRSADIFDNLNYYHKAADNDLIIFLLNKAKYFIEFSSQAMKNDQVHKDLRERFNNILENKFQEYETNLKGQ